MGGLDQTTEELIKEAEQLEDAGLLDKALENWRLILKRESDPIYLCRFGYLAMGLNNWAEAKQSFESAIQLYPNLSLPYECLGLLHKELGELDKAQNNLKKSVSIKETTRNLTILGSVQSQLGLTEEARDSLQQALRIDPDNEEALFSLALLLPEEKEQAITLLQRATEIDNEYAIAHRELGWLLRKANKYPEAQYHLQRAIELDNSDGQSYIYLGNLLWVMDDFGAAETAFKKAIEVWSDNSQPYWCLGIFYEYQDRAKEAEELYEQALDIDPDDIEANLRFGKYLIKIGEYEKAKVYLEHAFSLDTQDERIISALSSLE